MKYFSLTIILPVFLFCNRCSQTENAQKVECQIDMEFMLNYENCLLILTKARHGLPVDFKDRFRAVECLESITSHESNIIKYSDTPYLLYKLNPESPEEDLFDADLEMWLNWINSNKCNFNMKDAENTFLIRSKRLGVELDWPSPYYEG